MNKEKLKEAATCLDSAIEKIDTLLRKYPFVTKIDVTRRGRLELEMASRLLSQELENGSNENLEASTDGNNGERNNRNSEPGDSVDQPNDTVSKTNEATSQS